MLYPFVDSFDQRRTHRDAKPRPMTLFILAIIIFIMGSRLCTASDTLQPGQTLFGNQTLVSKNGIYELGLFTHSDDPYCHDYYLGIRIVNFSHSLLWVANKYNSTYDDPLMFELIISSTGNLVLTHSQKLVWSTNLTRSDETTSTSAVLLDTGNLVLKEDASISKIVWQSFDHPTDTWFQGAPLGFNTATGKNVYLTNDFYYFDSNENSFSLEFDPSRARGFIIRQLSTNATYHGIFPQFIDIVDDGNSLVTFNVPDKNHTFIQLYAGFVSMNWFNDPPNFNNLWFSPDTLCDFDSYCGPSSFCSGTRYIGKCSCPYGFQPADPEKRENKTHYSVDSAGPSAKQRTHHQKPKKGITRSGKAQPKMGCLVNFQIASKPAPFKNANRPKQTRQKESTPRTEMSLNPSGFYEVAVQYDLCMDLGKGCGLNTSDVSKAIRDDNAQRRDSVLNPVQENDPQDQQGPSIEFESDEDLMSEEEIE